MPGELLILGEYDPSKETHLATDRAINHTLQHLNAEISHRWVSTSEFESDSLETAAGLWIATGGNYAEPGKLIEAIQLARVGKIPCLGTCSGFQHIVLEYAQNMLGIQHAGHTEYQPETPEPFITQLPCSLRGKTMRIQLSRDSLSFQLYEESIIEEKYFCGFGINPRYSQAVQDGPIVVSGVDEDGEFRIVEYADHPFMLGTLFVPQVASIDRRPH
ncbi:MAG: CTP synthase, partial [Verrucomicrobiota bacterium]